MAQNEFTKANCKIGVPGQRILDAGLNVFGLQLFLESYTDKLGVNAPSVEFTYLGVKIRLQIGQRAILEGFPKCQK